MKILLMGEMFFEDYELYQRLKNSVSAIDRVGYHQEGLVNSCFYDYDFIFIEVNHFDDDLFSNLAKVRELDEEIPIILLSHKNSIEDKIHAFDAGVDDFITIPFELEELIARCKSILRRVKKTFLSHIVREGDLTINLETHEVMVNQCLVHLTGKEYVILESLVLRPGVLIRKATLLNQLYQDTNEEPDIKIIDVFVCKLRKKLQEAGAGDMISTMWGQGYIFGQPAEMVKKKIK